VDETATARAWPESILTDCSDKLSVAEVARVLSEERALRYLLSVGNPTLLLPGVKISKSWRIPREELSSYLLEHHDRHRANRDRPTTIGTP